MKLKIKEFRIIAKRKGYGNEKILYIARGGGDYGINAIKAGCRVGYEIVREIYNLFGSAILLEIVDMEEETVSGLESKFIKIGNKLY